jgi:hypothetical protein
VNLPRHGGVQVELPLSARTRRPGWDPEVPDNPPRPVVDALVAGVRLLTAKSVTPPGR